MKLKSDKETLAVYNDCTVVFFLKNLQVIIMKKKKN